MSGEGGCRAVAEPCCSDELHLPEDLSVLVRGAESVSAAGTPHADDAGVLHVYHGREMVVVVPGVRAPPLRPLLK